jgi:hypothetical protein
MKLAAAFALVVVESSLYGDAFTLAVGVAEDGAVLELPYVPPMGTPLIVRFLGAGDGDDDLAFRATVTAHSFVPGPVEPPGQPGRRLISVRFLEAVGQGPDVAGLASAH